MPPITMQHLSQTVNIAEVEQSAYEAYKRKAARSASFSEWITRLLPIGMALAVSSFYLLTAPHTVHMMNQFTPGWGWVAPMGLEFFIIIVAALRMRGWKTPMSLTLMWASVVASVIINMGGSLTAIVETAQVQNVASLPLTQLLEQFASLPAVSQVAFVLAIIFSVLIPIMSLYAGEGFMLIAMGKIKLTRLNIDEEWHKVRAEHIKAALMQAAMDEGAQAATAAKWASAYVERRYVQDAIGQALPAPTRELGFAAYHGTVSDSPNVSQQSQRVPSVPSAMLGGMQAMDSEDSLSSADSPKLSQKVVRQWLLSADNAAYAKTLIAQHGQRTACRILAREIGGSEAGYKTVERVLGR